MISKWTRQRCSAGGEWESAARSRGSAGSGSSPLPDDLPGRAAGKTNLLRAGGIRWPPNASHPAPEVFQRVLRFRRTSWQKRNGPPFKKITLHKRITRGLGSVRICECQGRTQISLREAITIQGVLVSFIRTILLRILVYLMQNIHRSIHNVLQTKP